MNDPTTWVEVDIGALEANCRAAAKHAGVPLCAVVKANGYGHGVVHAARAFVRAGASSIGVTRIEEARALRDGGIDAPVLLMTPVADPAEAVELDCSITVGSAEDVARLPAGARAQLEVDTGMGRFGVDPRDALATARAIRERAILEGVWTHFAGAAGPSGPPQLERFEGVLAALRAAGIDAAAHASNSAALLALPRARFDMVRVGTLLYGQDPPGARAPWPLRETFAWYARVSTIRTLPAGATVGYGSEWRAARPTRAGTLPVGFFDGFGVEPVTRTTSVRETARGIARLIAGRRIPRFVLFGERRAPVIGRIGMQAVTVSLDGLPDVAAGSVARIPARRLLVDGAVERIPVESP